MMLTPSSLELAVDTKEARLAVDTKEVKFAVEQTP
jgi:hypothetical protein